MFSRKIKLQRIRYSMNCEGEVYTKKQASEQKSSIAAPAWANPFTPKCDQYHISHSTKNVVFQSLLRGKMIIGKNLTTSRIYFSLEGSGNVLFERESERPNLGVSPQGLLSVCTCSWSSCSARESSSLCSRWRSLTGSAGREMRRKIAQDKPAKEKVGSIESRHVLHC